MSKFKQMMFDMLIKRPLMQVLDKVYEDDDITQLIQYKAGRATALGRIQGVVHPERFLSEADIQAVAQQELTALPASTSSTAMPVIGENGPDEQPGLPPKAVRRPGRPVRSQPSMQTQAVEFPGQPVKATNKTQRVSRMPQAIGPKTIRTSDEQSADTTPPQGVNVTNRSGEAGHANQD